MSPNIPVLIPGERFDVDVTFCLGEGLSPIEQLVIEAIHAGENRFEKLVGLFGLGHRPMLDLISDLWQAGHLYLDVHGGTVEIADDEVIDKIKKGKANELEPGRRDTEPVSLVHDLFAGHILPIMPASIGGENPLTVPRQKDLGTYKDVPSTEMSDIVEYILGTRDGPNRGEINKTDSDIKQKRVIGTALRGVSELTEGAQTQSWLTGIEVRLERTQGGRFTVQVVHPDAIDGRIRRDWEEKLAQLIDEQPDSWFVKRLVEKAEGISENAKPPLGLTQEIGVFQEDIAKFNAERKDASLSHGEWLNRERELLRRLNQRAAQRVRVDFVEPEKLDEALRAAIGRARHQLVLCSPNPEYHRFRQFEEALNKALRQGVRIFLLRDIRTDRELNRELRNTFTALEEKGGFFWTRQNVPTRTNERFLIRDREEVIFTTTRFLDGRPDLRCVVTARIRGMENQNAGPENKNHSCALAEELLGRIQRNLADHRLMNNFQTAPGDTTPLPEYLIHGEAGMPRLPGAPPEASAEEENDKPRTDMLRSASIGLWRESWEKYAQYLASRHADLMREGIARPVFDGEHGDLLMEMLTPGSTRHLLIASRQVSHRILTPQLDQRIRKCAESGMKIVLLLGREPDKGDPATGRIEELLRDCPGFERHIVPGCGGLLGSDRKLLITSLDLLGRDTQSQRRPESGVLFTGEGLLSMARARIAERHPNLAKFIGPPQADDRGIRDVASDAEQGKPDITGDIRELFDRIREVRGDESGEDPIPRVMAGWFRRRAERDTYWQCLDEIGRRLEADPNLRRMAIATALVEAAAERKREEGYFRWLERVATERWQSGRFTETWLLMEHGNLSERERGPLPPPWIAQLATLDPHGDDFQLIVMGALDAGDPAPESIDALLCMTAPALLFHGAHEVHETLVTFRSRCDGILAGWIEAVLDYWSSTGKPLPKEALRLRENAKLAREREFLAFDELQAAFEQARSINFKFPLGQSTWQHLFNPAGEYGRIEPMLEKKDSEAIRDLLANWEQNDMMPERLMDETTEQACRNFGIAPKHITSRKRPICLKRLRALENTMHAWIEAQDSLVLVEDTFLLEHAEQLAGKLRASASEIDGLLAAWEKAEDFRAPLLGRWRGQLRGILGV